MAPFWSAAKYRKPDFGFSMSRDASAADWHGFYDIKPFRPDPSAFNLTPQFRDITRSTGITPIPLYYRIGL